MYHPGHLSDTRIKLLLLEVCSQVKLMPEERLTEAGGGRSLISPRTRLTCSQTLIRPTVAADKIMNECTSSGCSLAASALIETQFEFSPALPPPPPHLPPKEVWVKYMYIVFLQYRPEASQSRGKSHWFDGLQISDFKFREERQTQIQIDRRYCSY